MSEKDKKMGIKMQRVVDITNFDNCSKILTAEKEILIKFIKDRKPVLNREGQDIMAGQLANLGNALNLVIGHLNLRIKELEKLNEDKTEE